MAFRAGMFNIGAAGQWIGGAIVATWLGYAVNLPIVLHAVVCIIGAFAGGAVIGWIVGVVKARTGAHEVILTIMLNYIMYNLLSFLLTSQSLMQAPKQTNAVAPGIASSAMLPHVGGPPPQVGVGFLIAVAAAAATAWLLSRSTLGFQFRTVGASPSAARSAGINVERVWILAFLIAGGLAGLSATTIVQGQTAPLTTTSYGTFGFDGITVALLGRARPWGVLIAGLLFGALDAGGTVMEASTGVPSDVVNVIEGLIVLFVAAPPLIRLLFRLRRDRRHRPPGRRVEGMVRMTTLTAPVRVPVSIGRRYLAAGTFILLGLIDIFVFGLFAHRGDAVFALSLPGTSPHLPSDPRSRGTDVLRARRDLDRPGHHACRRQRPQLGQAAVHRGRAAVLPAVAAGLGGRGQLGRPAPGHRPAAGDPDRVHPAGARRPGRFAGRAVRCHQHRDRGPAALRRVHRGGRGQRHRRGLARADRRVAGRRPGRERCSRYSRSCSWWIRSSSAWCST